MRGSREWSWGRGGKQPWPSVSISVKRIYTKSRKTRIPGEAEPQVIRSVIMTQTLQTGLCYHPRQRPEAAGYAHAHPSCLNLPVTLLEAETHPNRSFPTPFGTSNWFYKFSLEWITSYLHKMLFTLTSLHMSTPSVVVDPWKSSSSRIKYRIF